MITIQSIQHIYKRGETLSFPDWTVRQGEYWLMQGNSGSGKTTLLHIVCGLLKPLAGEVHINDTNIYKLDNGQADHFRGRNIGLIFQRPHLVKSLNVLENIMLAQSCAGLPIDKKRIGNVLSSLGMTGKMKSYPAQLSQGQLQRVTIARAVVNKPALIMADEPTSSLDDVHTRSVLALLINQAKENGATLIIATHDQRVKEKITNVYHVGI